MATLCRLHENHYGVVVITILIIHLLRYSMKVTANTDHLGGFTTHLIRKDAPHSPLYDHKSGRSLMGPDTTQSILIVEKGVLFHLMKLSIGTPPVETYAIADTGSTLLWTQCRPCMACTRTHDMFDPKMSSSYDDITCNAPECTFLKNTSRIPCKLPEDKCSYSYRYADRSYSEGTLAKETITLTSTSGKPIALKDIIIGCSHNNTGLLTENEMGIIGLGRGPLSFVSQIAPFVGGRKFSHCLVHMHTDPKITSKIGFGSGSEISGKGTVSTHLVGNNNYLVKVKGFTIGGNFVPFISGATMINAGSMIIDSGTPVTRLPPSLYDRLETEFMRTLDPKLQPFRYTESKLTIVCMYTPTIPTEPSMTVHFEDGSKLQLTAEHLFIRYMDDIFCTTFGKTSNAELPNDVTGLYGSLMLANFLVGFDLDRKVVSFKPTDCTKIGTGTPPPIQQRRNIDL